MTNEKKIELIAETLDYDGELNADMVLADMDVWDSMAKLSLIVMMDDEFGKTLSGAQIREFKTVGDILDYMSH